MLRRAREREPVTQAKPSQPTFLFLHFYHAEFNFGHCSTPSNQHWCSSCCMLPCFCMPTEFIGILLPADIEKRGPLAVWLAACCLAYFARRLTLISHACITRWPAAVLLFRRQCSAALAIGNFNCCSRRRTPTFGWRLETSGPFGVCEFSSNIYKMRPRATRLIKIRVEFVWHKILNFSSSFFAISRARVALTLEYFVAIHCSCCKCVCGYAEKDAATTHTAIKIL